MGQAAKYAVLAGGIALVLGLIAALIGQFVSDSIFSGFSTAVGGLLSTSGNVIMSVKGLINYFLGGGAAASAFNILLWLNLLYPVAKMGVKVTIYVIRWMNQ